jgi:hypothetical protein
MKKIKGLLLFIVCIAVGLFIANELRMESNYEDFLLDYQNIIDNFTVDGFSEIEDGEMQYSYAGFPENDYFSEVDDIVDQDFNKPVKKNIYYINDEKSILVYISHMYSREKLKKHMITLDIPSNECKNIDSLYFEEYYMTYDNTFVSLKIFSLKKSKQKNFNDVSIDIIQNYIKVLK